MFPNKKEMKIDDCHRKEALFINHIVFFFLGGEGFWSSIYVETTRRQQDGSGRDGGGTVAGRWLANSGTVAGMAVERWWDASGCVCAVVGCHSAKRH